METVKALYLDPYLFHNPMCQPSGQDAVVAQRPHSSLRLPQASCPFHLTAPPRFG